MLILEHTELHELKEKFNAVEAALGLSNNSIQELRRESALAQQTQREEQRRVHALALAVVEDRLNNECVLRTREAEKATLDNTLGLAE
eukprot:3106474-Heterocapsa_arctica.AAC.1